MRTRGFTLIEILIALSLVGLMVTVALPVSYSMYRNYKDSLQAETLLIRISSLKRESFLYGKRFLVEAREGRMYVNGKEEKAGPDLAVTVETPVVFYRNGTTSGGIIRIRAGENKYAVVITPPLGEMKLARD